MSASAFNASPLTVAVNVFSFNRNLLFGVPGGWASREDNEARQHNLEVLGIAPTIQNLARIFNDRRRVKITFHRNGETSSYRMTRAGRQHMESRWGGISNIHVYIAHVTRMPAKLRITLGEGGILALNSLGLPTSVRLRVWNADSVEDELALDQEILFQLARNDGLQLSRRLSVQEAQVHQTLTLEADMLQDHSRIDLDGLDEVEERQAQDEADDALEAWMRANEEDQDELDPDSMALFEEQQALFRRD